MYLTEECFKRVSSECRRGGDMGIVVSEQSILKKRSILQFLGGDALVGMK